jgi:hypothetical protein
MRGSGAAVGLVALPIAGLILLILKIFRIKHSYDLMDIAGLVIAWLAGGVWVGMILYCFGIALGFCRPLSQL